LLQVVGTLALCGAFSWLFSRPSLLRDIVPDAGTGYPWRAALVGALFLVVLVAVGPRLVLRGARIDAYVLAVCTAVAVDIVAEGRARLGRDLVSVWPIHRVQTADLAQAALRDAGIDAHLRGAGHRTLLFFFGPYVPIEVMVPAAQATAARAVLDQLFHPAPVRVFE
jgi:hypothetical protein